MKLGSLLAAAIAGVMLPMGASAATVGFATTPPQQLSEWSFNVGSITVTVKGYSYTRPAQIGGSVTPFDQADLDLNNQGLGVCDDLNTKPCKNGMLDAIPANGGPEVVVFSFSSAVTIGKVKFNQNDNGGDDVDLMTSLSTSFPLTLVETRATGAGPQNDTFTLGAPDYAGVSMFAVGIAGHPQNPLSAVSKQNGQANSDQLRLESLVFECVAIQGVIKADCNKDDGDVPGPEPVPLPAGLPLLATALGLGALLRRRKS
ncbi:MAG: VPLPA-CTERM sorting domain-containing protein [Rhodobacteraceae bacterium]|nr:VPLPA-CTERM sorting domain-containing protein [Alphaproteobacteria bacterium]MCB1407800.1 VPLPA-CTERM sorting domain-containing protein [Paracoccaceae bacterium]